MINLLIMKILIRFIFFSILMSDLYPASKKHFTDQQIANMIPNYFYREHNSPNIKRIRVYGKDNEKYLHMEIDVNRNRYQGEADFTLYAMADITQYAKIPFDKFVIIMYPAIKSEEPEMIKADARCTIDYLINKSKTKKRWSETCIKTSTDFENFVAPNSKSSLKEESSNDQFDNYIILFGILAISSLVFYFIKKNK